MLLHFVPCYLSSLPILAGAGRSYIFTCMRFVIDGSGCNKVPPFLWKTQKATYGSLVISVILQQEVEDHRIQIELSDEKSEFLSRAKIFLRFGRKLKWINLPRDPLYLWVCIRERVSCTSKSPNNKEWEKRMIRSHKKVITYSRSDAQSAVEVLLWFIWKKKKTWQTVHPT